jgi:adenosine deaminase/adenosine deaminase CECR1
LVDDWSVKDYEHSNESGHDHFFATFSDFGGATSNMSTLLAELRSRAALENVEYLELMTSSGGSSQAAGLGSSLGWDDNMTCFYEKLTSHGLKDIAKNASHYLNESDARSIEILEDRCDPGSNVTVRYQYTASRIKPKQEVFAQLALAFEVAEISPLVVGINLLAAEDDWVARENYTDHMRMIDFLHKIYSDVKIALHAGELDLGLVPPEDLRFHIREALQLGHASRIGHGVDIMREVGSQEILATMARDGVAVEIMPVSNQVILDVLGEDHPFPVYFSRGVPIVLASDDPGVLRTDLTEQFVIIAHTYPQVEYSDFKRFVRNSLEYSFLEGDGIWALKGDYSRLRDELDGCLHGCESEACRAFMEKNDKAEAEWRLEGDLAAFEEQLGESPLAG